MSSERNLLVTAALIYANGSVHLGHLVEYIQADIWVRFQRMRGNKCVFVCGNDAHGTPIMISAQKQGITPEQLIEKIHAEHQKDFEDFHVVFDYFDTTHSDENQKCVAEIYSRLKERGDITTRLIKQAYDPVENMFLPDRYVKGECPRCGAKDQYGDHCEACGATYLPSELKNPVSAISGAEPIEKESEHYFFELGNYEKLLEEWLRKGDFQAAVVRKLDEWFQVGLEAWDISRDTPYFGFEIPDAPNKYFYVWLDAPIGYMASFQNLAKQQTDLDFNHYWNKDSSTELYHFIGKDIVYFHALFWPAMLEGAGFRKPTNLFCHGFLTVNGEKMSKSRGTFLNARDYLNHLDPECLRYYFAAKLSEGVEDIDLNFDDFLLRVNSDLVGKVVNIASRTAGFIYKKFDGMLADSLANPELFDQFVSDSEEVAQYFEKRQYSQAVRKIMSLADIINRYIDEKKPWILMKEPGNEEEVQLVCTLSLNLFKVLMTYLKPILPAMAEKVEVFLNISPMDWESRKTPLLSHKINKFKPLLERVQSEDIEALLSK